MSDEDRVSLLNRCWVWRVRSAMRRLKTQLSIFVERNQNKPIRSPALQSDGSGWQEEERRATSHEVNFSPHESPDSPELAICSANK